LATSGPLLHVHSQWNFRPEGGRCYGYVMTRHFAGIDLSRISDAHEWGSDEELEGVDIVYVARKPDIGQVVVGWYINATIFHRSYRHRRGKKAKGDWDQIEYLSEVESDNAHLLPEDKRNFAVPRGKGFPGQSNVWYGNRSDKNVTQFEEKLRHYITKGLRDSPENEISSKRLKHFTPDKDFMLLIEKAAIAETWKFYEDIGFAVKTVERDNRGWDLEASKSGIVLRLEVKGHAGNVVQFELTPNEYVQMQRHKNAFRVCVVRNALTEPDLKVFIPTYKQDHWILYEDGGTEEIKLLEKVAAKASQV
jgi:hypothetical protein